MIKRAKRFILLCASTMALIGAAVYVFDDGPAAGILTASFIVMALIVLGVWVLHDDDDIRH